jgi:hypothetical protein
MSPHALVIVTSLSLALAAIMSVVAWRVSRAERRRAEARIVALSAEIHDEAPVASVAASGSNRVEIGIRGEPPRRFPAPAAVGPRSFMHDLPLRDTAMPVRDAGLGSELFAGAAQPEASATRIVAVVALGVFVIAAVAALAIVLGGAWPTLPAIAHSRTTTPGITGTTGTARPAATAPLELVGLSHERDGDRLTIRGVVHNPDSATAIDDVDAVVAVYDRDGAVMTSARAPLARTPLDPGGESPFVVTVENAADVGRYRVSFRAGDRVIAHVDRRSRTELAGQVK